MIDPVSLLLGFVFGANCVLATWYSYDQRHRDFEISDWLAMAFMLTFGLPMVLVVVARVAYEEFTRRIKP